MFGKTLVGLVALLVLGVGGFMYFDSSSCPDRIPGSCSNSSASVTSSCCSGEEETVAASCCQASSSASACCEASKSSGSCEALTVLPREVK